MLGKLFQNQAIGQFSSNCIKFGWLFLAISYAQSKGSPDQQNPDPQVEQTSLAAENHVQSQLEEIQKIFDAFLNKCAENGLYDQILPCTKELLSIIEQELKNNDSAKRVNARSTAAKSNLFKIAALLATDTLSSKKNLLKDLAKIYQPVSKIFGWKEETRKKIARKLFADFKRQHRWNYIKGLISGPIGVSSAAVGFFFTIVSVIQFFSDLQIGLFGKKYKNKKKFDEIQKQMNQLEDKFENLSRAFKKNQEDLADHTGLGQE